MAIKKTRNNSKIRIKKINRNKRKRMLIKIMVAVIEKANNKYYNILNI